MTRPDSTPHRDADVVLRRDLDLPPGVVWPALVDPELLAGWLGEAAIRDDLSFSLRTRGGIVNGSITAMLEAERLELATERGPVLLRLEEHTGGLRGSWTALTVEARTSVAPVDAWTSALERLEQLLHGRPTDWSHSTAHELQQEAR